MHGAACVPLLSSDFDRGGFKSVPTPDIAQGGAVHVIGVNPNVEEATEDAAPRAVDFAVARTGLNREEAYMLLSIIGELRIGTSPRR